MAVTPFYSSLTIPAGTAKADYVSQAVSVVPGRAILLRLFVPPGPRGEVSLWLKHQETQIAPVPPATWDNLDAITYEYPLDREVPIGETTFQLCGYSTYANFPHSIDFELLVTASSPAEQTRTSHSLLARLTGVLGG